MCFFDGCWTISEGSDLEFDVVFSSRNTFSPSRNKLSQQATLTALLATPFDLQHVKSVMAAAASSRIDIEDGRAEETQGTGGTQGQRAQRAQRRQRNQRNWRTQMRIQRGRISIART